ncbi:hypothetical protein GCM10010387_42130 [Streptomyces inusitatus]|uniref:Uncharacterized protein n=1 Tax=Streptomyces inusitatus TaxID=68221 RepID=A0A918QFJ5_9ACTN|nr:hypothetical protein GCM10010387_42130 [Streptomyces inusitatus]
MAVTVPHGTVEDMAVETGFNDWIRPFASRLPGTAGLPGGWGDGERAYGCARCVGGIKHSMG